MVRESALVAAMILWTVAPYAMGAEPLRLSDLMVEARANNPTLRAARERAEAAAAEPARASAYDDPIFTYEAFNAPESFRLDHADNNIFKVSQSIPFPGKRTLAGKAAQHEAAMAEAEARAADIDLIAALKRAYYALWGSRQKFAVYSRDRDLVERFAKVSQDRYAVGLVAQSDVLRAQVERTKLINLVTTEGLMGDRAEAELNAVLSRGPQATLGTPEDPPPPRLDQTLETLVENATRQRPEIAAQQAAIEKEEAKVRQARLDYLPDFDFTASRFVNYRNRDGFGAMASATIPLAYKYKYDAALSEARARLRAAEADQRRTQDGIRREVTDAYLRARTALLQYELFTSTHIPQAEQALAGSEVGYQTGKIDFLSLIDSIRAVESVHLEHVSAATDFQQALADLERATGGELSAEGDTNAR